MAHKGTQHFDEVSFIAGSGEDAVLRYDRPWAPY